VTRAIDDAVKAIARVAVNIATLGLLMSSPPSRANHAPISANDVPTVHVAIASIAANVRMARIRGGITPGARARRPR
jgi:hypothetical protein